MEQWLRSAFAVTQQEGEDHILFPFGPGVVLLPVSLVAQAFDGVTTPPTAAALKGADPEDARGWHQYIDAWIEQGIIPAE